MRNAILSVTAFALVAGLALSAPPASADTVFVVWVSCGSDGKYHLTSGDYEYIDGPCGGPIMSAEGDTSVKLVVGDRTEISGAGRTFLNRLDSGDIRIGALRRIPGGRSRAAPDFPGRTLTILVASGDAGPGLSSLLKKLDPRWKASAAR